MTNPFYEMAIDLDSMEQDVTSWEADFLESVLKRFKEKQPLTPKQEEKLKEIHKKYQERGWLDESAEVEAADEARDML